MLFFVKSCLSRRPYSDQGVATEQGVAMAFYRIPYGVLGGDSLRSHAAFTARPRRSQRMRRAFMALPLRWRRSDIWKNAVQSPCKCHGRPRRLHNGPCVRPWSSYCVVGDLTARLWWPYGDPLRSIRAPSERQVRVFVLSMLKVRTVVWRSMRPHRVQWRCHCVAAVMLVFVLRAPLRSAIFRTPWDHREDATLVWQGF